MILDDWQQNKSNDHWKTTNLWDFYNLRVRARYNDIELTHVPESLKKRYQRVFALDSDKDVFEKMMKDEIGKSGGHYCITVRDIGVLMQREKDKLVTYSINLNPALIEVLNEIASIHPRGENLRAIWDLNRLGVSRKIELRTLSAEHVARLLSADLFSVFHEAWRPLWFRGINGKLLANIVNESMVDEIWRDKMLRSIYSTELVSILHDLRSEGVSEELVKGPLEVLSLEQVRALLSGPIFRNLEVDQNKAVDGAQLAAWLDSPSTNQERLKEICLKSSDFPLFLERLRDVQAGRASHSPCRLPLLSLTKEEVKLFLEFLRSSRVLGTEWYNGLNGKQLLEAARSPTHASQKPKTLTSTINDYYTNGVPEELVRRKGGWTASTDDEVRSETKSRAEEAYPERKVDEEAYPERKVDEEAAGSKDDFGKSSDEGVEVEGKGGESALDGKEDDQEKGEQEDLAAVLRDDKYGKDLIGTSIFAEALAEMIFEGASLPLVVGLFAPWGAGKSFLLEKVETHMKFLILKNCLSHLKDRVSEIYFVQPKEHIDSSGSSPTYEKIEKSLANVDLDGAIDELRWLKEHCPKQLKQVFKWCQFLGAPEPTTASFDSGTYDFSDRYFADQEFARQSSISFLIWSLRMILYPTIALTTYFMSRDFIDPVFRAVDVDMSSRSPYQSMKRIWFLRGICRYFATVKSDKNLLKRRNLLSALWLHNVDKRRLPKNKKGGNKAEEKIKKDFHFIFFNAWLYCGSDDLWAGLVKALHEAVEERYGPSYAFAKYRAKLVLILIALLVSVGLMVGSVAFYIRINDDFQELSSTGLILHTVGVILGTALSLVTGASAVYSYLVTPSSSSEEIEMICSKAEVKKKLGFMAVVKDELEDIGNTLRDPGRHLPTMWTYLRSWLLLQVLLPEFLQLLPELPEWLLELLSVTSCPEPCNLVIFVDDLDRCPPEKIVQVLQALVLLAENSPFVFFLAVDPRIVVAAVESQDQGMYTAAGVDGYEYLDKIVQIPFTIPMMCDSEKADLARGYLDLHFIPKEGMLLWLDTRRVTDNGRCNTRIEDDAVALKKKFVTTSRDSRGVCISFSEGLALLQDTRTAKTIFAVHSGDVEEREAGNMKGWYYYRCNGGRLMTKIDRGIEKGDQAYRITCRIVVVYATDLEVEATREMVVYGRVLGYKEIVDVESYLSKQWGLKLRSVSDDEALLDAKRADFLSTFDPKAKPYAVSRRLALLNQDRYIPRKSSEDLDAYTLREVETLISPPPLPAKISISDCKLLMEEVNVPFEIANVMWEEYPGTSNDNISKDELMALLGLNPDLDAADFQMMAAGRGWLRVVEECLRAGQSANAADT
eukprot:gene1414-1610_t